MPGAIQKPVTEEAVGDTTAPTAPTREARVSWFARYSEQPAPGAVRTPASGSSVAC